MKKEAAGLILVTRLPIGKYACVLGVRKKDDSWGGACQPTCHGGKNPDEDFIACVLREAMEELGERLANILKSGVFIKLEHKVEPDKEIITYCTFIDYQVFQCNVVKGPEIAYFRFVDDPNTLRELVPEDKKRGVPEYENAMFSDNLRAVKTALTVHFRNNA